MFQGLTRIPLAFPVQSRIRLKLSYFTQHSFDRLAKLFFRKVGARAIRRWHRRNQNSFDLVSLLGVLYNEEGKEIPEIVVAAPRVPRVLPEPAAHSGSLSNIVGDPIPVEDVYSWPCENV